MSQRIDLPATPSDEFVTIVFPDGKQYDVFASGIVQVYYPEGAAYEINVSGLTNRSDTDPVARLG